VGDSITLTRALRRPPASRVFEEEGGASPALAGTPGASPPRRAELLDDEPSGGTKGRTISLLRSSMDGGRPSTPAVATGGAGAAMPRPEPLTAGPPLMATAPTALTRGVGLADCACACGASLRAVAVGLRAAEGERSNGRDSTTVTLRSSAERSVLIV